MPFSDSSYGATMSRSTHAFEDCRSLNSVHRHNPEYILYETAVSSPGSQSSSESCYSGSTATTTLNSFCPASRSGFSDARSSRCSHVEQIRFPYHSNTALHEDPEAIPDGLSGCCWQIIGHAHFSSSIRSSSRGVTVTVRPSGRRSNPGGKATRSPFPDLIGQLQESGGEK